MVALSALSLTLTLLSAPSGPITWVEDDWERARTQAKAAGKLVAVDVWATWCHTCLSMKSFVLTEKPFAKVADEHVWLSLDYDLPKNVAFFKQFPIDVFPTFLVVDPKKNEVVARWAGSGTAEQMVRFFAEAKPDAGDALSRGRRALALRDHAKAAEILEKALPEEKSKDRRTEILAAYIEALWKLDPKKCVRVGAEHIDETDNTAPGVDFVALVAYCADGLEDQAEKKRVFGLIRDRLEQARKVKKLPLSVDDQSTIYSTLADAYKTLGEAKKAKAVTQAHAKILEAGAKKAKTAQARATFDAYRLSCYLDLEQFDKAEKMLTASEKAMPKDFNPPWRLAVLYHAQNKSDAGLAAIGRALERGYGPRRARLWSTKIDLLMQKKSYEQALTTIADARKDLGKLDKALVLQAWLDKLDAQEKDVRELQKKSS